MKKSGKGYYLKKSLKVIDLVIFDIDNHKREILAVRYKNENIELREKWNQLNIINMK